MVQWAWSPYVASLSAASLWRSLRKTLCMRAVGGTSHRLYAVQGISMDSGMVHLLKPPRADEMILGHPGASCHLSNQSPTKCATLTKSTCKINCYVVDLRRASRKTDTNYAHTANRDLPHWVKSRTWTGISLGLTHQ